LNQVAFWRFTQPARPPTAKCSLRPATGSLSTETKRSGLLTGQPGLRTVGFPPIAGVFTAELLDPGGQFYHTNFTILSCPVQWTGVPIRFGPSE
jgi:hypothetical protein